MDIHIYGMVFCTGIWGIFYFVEFNVSEIFHDLNFLNLAILLHYSFNIRLIHFDRFEATDKQLPN